MTLVQLFLDRLAQSGPRPALWIKREGQFQSRTWDELGRAVRRAAAVLVELGVQPGDRVIQISENRYEWIVADLAILLSGAIHVPVHASLTGPQIAYQIRDSGARVVMVSTAAQAAKLADQLADVRKTLQLVGYEPCEPLPGWAGSWHLNESIRSPLEDSLPGEKCKPDTIATILYTSGTTGEPKGVMLSHRNLVSNAKATLEAFTVTADDLRLTWLPLSHIFARTCDLYGWIAAGSQLALAESRETILADCAAIRPTLMNGVPYFFDKVQRLLVERGLADDPAKLQELLGGRVHHLCSGGAALPDHTAKFFQERGVLLVQGYGLTESSPVICVSTETAHKLGTVGRPIRDVEVRIAADGEILARGPNIMLGYWQKPRETAAVLENGWLHTGDLGELDAEGFLKITGRKKELIVTAAGKNIAPVYLESLLTEDPLISQALVIGDGRNYLTALIVPNQQTLAAELIPRGLLLAELPDWPNDERVRAVFTQRIARCLADVSPAEQVRKFVLLERPFAADTGELTPTLKLRRGVICQKYGKLIDSMYT
jgi:long-chain acyl-CoA synthetase